MVRGLARKVVTLRLGSWASLGSWHGESPWFVYDVSIRRSVL
jgi:hypothetical protein